MSASIFTHGRSRSLTILRNRISTSRSSITASSTTAVLPNNTVLNNTTCTPLFHHQQQRNMGRKAAKMGQHLKRLDEMAHEGEHARAKERRTKKKGNKSAPQQKEVVEDLPSIEEDESESQFEKSNQEEEQDLPSQEEVKGRMMKVVRAMEDSFRAIRGTEPTPDLFDAVQVKAYGAMTPLSSVAQVVITSPTRATITCFDPENAPGVRDGVRDMTGMNFNPQIEEGNVIVHIPRTSAETRKAIVKQLGKAAERSRARLRGIRRGAQDIVKLGKDGKISGISEDDAFRVGKDIDATTEECNKILTEIVEKKQALVMDV